MLGVGQGLVGVVAKPVVGALDAIAHATEGFRDLAMVISLEKRLEPVHRHRMLHIFAADGRLLPYDSKVGSSSSSKSDGTITIHSVDSCMMGCFSSCPGDS